MFDGVKALLSLTHMERAYSFVSRYPTEYKSDEFLEFFKIGSHVLYLKRGSAALAKCTGRLDAQGSTMKFLHNLDDHVISNRGGSIARGYKILYFS